MARILLAVLAGLVLAAVPAAADPGRSCPSAERALRAADEALGRAWATRNVEAYMKHYDDGAVALWSGEPARSKGEYRDFTTALFADPHLNVRGRQLDIQMAASGDLAYVRGRSEITRTGPDGVVVTPGSWVNIWRRHGGDWKIVVEVFVAGDGTGPQDPPLFLPLEPLRFGTKSS